ncbi:MAG: class E sortase [Actinobacteria bacterium]|nr:class E sortase [Actinomycetota bacterium]
MSSIELTNGDAVADPEAAGAGASGSAGSLRLRHIDRTLDLLAHEIGVHHRVPDRHGEGVHEVAPALVRRAGVLLDEASQRLGGDATPEERAALADRRVRLSALAARLDPTVAPASPPPPAPRAMAGPGGIAAAPSPAPSPPPAAPLGAAVARGRTDRRTVLRGLGQGLTAVGAVLALFLAYQVWTSGIVHSRAQQLLVPSFRAAALRRAALASSASAATDDGQSGLLTSGSGSDPAPAGPTALPPPPSAGAPIAILQVPSIGIDEVVVQGAGAAQLRSGPGHDPSTSMPGEPGASAIAGARVGYGGPFRALDRVRRGADVFVTTWAGRFRYEVESVAVVRSGEPDPVRAERPWSSLVLLTSAPRFLATQRLAVVARLRTRPLTGPLATKPSALQPGPGAFGGARGGVVPLVLRSQLLVVAFFVSRRLYRRWLRWPTYLLTSPVLLALLIGVFESLGSLLPATF